MGGQTSRVLSCPHGLPWPVQVAGQQRRIGPTSVAWSLAHGSFLLHSCPHPDLPSPETGLPQDWSSVEEDGESEDSQVCERGFSPSRPPTLKSSVGCHTFFFSLGFPCPMEFLRGVLWERGHILMVVRHKVEGLHVICM